MKSIYAYQPITVLKVKDPAIEPNTCPLLELELATGHVLPKLTFFFAVLDVNQSAGRDCVLWIPFHLSTLADALDTFGHLDVLASRKFPKYG